MTGIKCIFLISEKLLFLLCSNFSGMIGGIPALPRASSGDRPMAEQGAATARAFGSLVAEAAVERREGARAYVIGAWSTLARCSGVSLSRLATGGGEARHGCGVPHQRPRGAPLPRGSNGLE